MLGAQGRIGRTILLHGITFGECLGHDRARQGRPGSDGEEVSHLGEFEKKKAQRSNVWIHEED